MMRRVENHKLVGIPIGVILGGSRVIDTLPCKHLTYCKTHYSNFAICGGRRGLLSTGENMCGFRTNYNDTLLEERWVQ